MSIFFLFFVFIIDILKIWKGEMVSSFDKKRIKTMVEKIEKTNEFKNVVKNALSEKTFENVKKSFDIFESLSVFEKIEMLDFLSNLPRSPRKTLCFSAFVKAKKKEISRSIYRDF